MKNLFAKTFMTLVSNGNDMDAVKNIMNAIDLVNGRHYGECKCYDVYRSKSTTKLIEVKTTKRRYHKMQGMIEMAYPGLCVFSASV